MGEAVLQARVAQQQARQVASEMATLKQSKADADTAVDRSLLREALAETHTAMEASISVRRLFKHAFS